MVAEFDVDHICSLVFSTLRSEYFYALVVVVGVVLLADSRSCSGLIYLSHFYFFNYTSSFVFSQLNCHRM